MENCEHPNIVKIYDCIDSGKFIIIVLELVAGMSLSQYLEKIKDHKIDEQTGANIFKQIVSAVDYLHSKGIAHRDLKLENILITPTNEIKLIDFGFSIWIKKEGKMKLFCGTPTYMAPEIINKPEYEAPPVDIWALGVILFTLLVGVFPFISSRNSELYRRITKGIFSFPEHVSIQAQKLISDMLTVDPSKRIFSNEILKYTFFDNKC